MAGAVVVSAGIGLCFVLIRHDGVMLSGDEPHYLVAALAIGKFHTLHVGEAYRYAMAHNVFIHWGTRFGPQAVASGHAQAVLSHHSYFAFHELGIPFLLALPVAVGGVHGAELAFAGLIGLLTATVAYLVGRVVGTASPWRVAVIGLFLSPAYLLAGTQIYPDLLSGLVLAIVVLLVAEIEAHGRMPALPLVVMGVLIGYLPWLHTKNIIVAAVAAIAVAAVFWRAGLPWPRLLLVAAPVIVLWGLLAVYNTYVFGNLSGSGDNGVTFDLATWTRAAALLIDRRQGIVTQLPAVLVGVAGLWLFRRRTPIAVVTTVVCAPIVIIVNATLVNSFGGFSFVGRLQWEIAPLLLAFAGLTLLQLARARRRAFAVITAVLVALTVIEWIPVLANSHLYYNVGEWDPSAYTGWWGFLDPFSPILGDFTRPWNAVWHGDRVWLSVVFVALVSAAVVYAVARLGRDPAPEGAGRRARIPAPAVGAVVGIVAVGLATVLAAPPLPAAAVYPASTLPSSVGTIVNGARVVQGPSPPGVLVFGPSLLVQPGRYTASFRYSLQDPATQLADVAISASPTSPALTVARIHLESTHSLSTATVPFSIKASGYLQLRVFWSGTGRLMVTTVTLRTVALG